MGGRGYIQMRELGDFEDDCAVRNYDPELNEVAIEDAQEDTPRDSNFIDAHSPRPFTGTTSRYAPNIEGAFPEEVSRGDDAFSPMNEEGGQNSCDAIAQDVSARLCFSCARTFSRIA